MTLNGKVVAGWLAMEEQQLFSRGELVINSQGALLNMLLLPNQVFYCYTSTSAGWLRVVVVAGGAQPVSGINMLWRSFSGSVLPANGVPSPFNLNLGSPSNYRIRHNQPTNQPTMKVTATW